MKRKGYEQKGKTKKVWAEWNGWALEKKGLKCLKIYEAKEKKIEARMFYTL